ncbi:MAG: substrate-binding domain-containing protein [Nitrospirae bacterium]|nr:substrate-binding domain-containing protein [Nitrospirota bacterium]
MKPDKFTVVNSVRIIYPRLIISSAVVLCLMLTSIYLYASDMKGTIKIGGTGTALGSFKELGEAFKKIHPDVNIVILPSLGSGGGIMAVNEGALDIGLSSRPLKDAEIRQGAVSVEYARTPFVFATALKIEGTNFTLKDIAKIFSGETKNWPDGTPIRLVLRPESDMDTIILKGMSPEMDKSVRKSLSQEGMMVAATDQEGADTMEKVRGAIGTSTLAQIISEKRHLNTIRLSGVMPDMKNLADGSYKYYKTLFIVTGPKSGPVTKSFIEFINSKEGKAILTKTGHLPI